MNALSAYDIFSSLAPCENGLPCVIADGPAMAKTLFEEEYPHAVFEGVLLHSKNVIVQKGKP